MLKRFLPFFILTSFLFAQNNKPESGLPFITTFKPKDFGGDLQTWAFVQDKDGIIYAGNQPGVVQYDGANWRMINTANNTFVRSMAIDNNGRIYVGAQADFGYLEADSNGELKFISLLKYVDKSHHLFSYTWTTFSAGNAVYFQSFEWIFRFEEKEDGGWDVKIWSPQTRFNYAFWFAETYFVMQGSIGLMKMENDSLVLLPGGNQFANDRLQVMMPLNPGTEDSNHFIVGTFNRGLFEFDGTGFKPFRTEADQFLRDNTLYEHTILADGTYALATIVGGIVILDSNGKNPKYLTTENA